MVVLNVGIVSQLIKQVMKNLLFYSMNLLVVVMMRMVMELRHKIIQYPINYHLVVKVNKFPFIYVHPDL